METRLLADWAHPPTHPTLPNATRVRTFHLPTNYRSGSAIIHAGATSLGGGGGGAPPALSPPSAAAASAPQKSAGTKGTTPAEENAGGDQRSSLRVVPAPGAPRGDTVLRFVESDHDEAKAARDAALLPLPYNSPLFPFLSMCSHPHTTPTLLHPFFCHLSFQVVDLMWERAMGPRKVPFGDMAVIYRNHVLSTAVERELKRRRIKYVLLSGTSLFDREEARVVECSTVRFAAATCTALLCRRPSPSLSFSFGAHSARSRTLTAPFDRSNRTTRSNRSRT